MRQHLLDSILLQPRQTQIILLEARAGQGKTTLAVQLLERCNAPALWLTLTREDQDPYHFITSLLRCLTEKYSTAKLSSALQDYLNGGGAKYEASHYVRLLGKNIAGALAKKCWLVLDDAQLLTENPRAAELLSELLSLLPPQMKIVLTSREPLPLKKHLRDAARVIDAEQLKFSLDETRTLFQGVLDMALPCDEIERIHRRSEGWAMGLLLEGYTRLGNGAAAQTGDDDESWQPKLEDYFLRNVLPLFSTQVKAALCRFALLETIPEALALGLVETEALHLDLQGLAQSNHFIQMLGDTEREYRLHHLFREALRHVAPQVLSAEEMTTVYRLAAEYYEACNVYQEAIRYWLSAADLSRANALLGVVGMRLRQENCLSGVLHALSQYSDTEIREFGWFAYFKGMQLLETSPPAAKPFFVAAEHIFVTTHQHAGELLAAAQLIHYFVFIECCFESGRELLERVSPRATEILEMLEPRVAVQVAINLAIGSNFILGDHRQAMKYLTLAEQLGGTPSSQDTLAMICFMRGMTFNMNGKLELFAEEIERSVDYLASAEVTFFTKLLIQTMMTNYPFWIADHANFKRLSEEIYRNCAGNAPVMSSIDPWQLIMQADLEFARGDLAATRRLIETCAYRGYGVGMPHLQSQLLQTQALLECFEGRGDKAVALAQESRELRASAGGTFFRMWNGLAVGAVQIETWHFHAAEECLLETLTLATEWENEPMRAAALAYLACLYLRHGDISGALENTDRFLKIMRENALHHFICWVPSLLREVIGLAVSCDVEADYARFLARERFSAFVDDRGHFHAKFELQVLGGVKISIADGTELIATDLTPNQRRFLALLNAAPGLQLSQERIQEYLWPEKTAAKARGSFDVFISRLRKLLSETFVYCDINDFLVVSRGMVQLKNCISLSARFRKLAQTGLSLCNNRHPWRGGNALFLAYQSGSGEYAPNSPACEVIRDQRLDYEFLYLDVSLQWARVLQRFGNDVEAIRVLNGAFKGSPDNQAVATELYHAQLRAADIVAANAVLKRFLEQMATEGFSAADLAEIQRQVISGAIEH